MSDIYEYKWTNGIPYEKSKKNERAIENALSVLTYNNEQVQQLQEQSKISPTFQSNIQSQQLTHNKRELSNDKINERMMFSQINQNPFLANHNYIEDISIQEKLLRPKNSNFELDSFNKL